MEIKVGDLVKCVSAMANDKLTIGKSYKVINIDSTCFPVLVINDSGEREWFPGGFFESAFIKDRINALQNFWDKEYDDILREITPKLPNCCHPKITISLNQSYLGGVIICFSDLFKGTFSFDTTQFSRLQAFKAALLYLAEEAGMIKEEIKPGDEIKGEIEGKVYKIKIIE